MNLAFTNGYVLMAIGQVVKNGFFKNLKKLFLIVTVDKEPGVPSTRHYLDQFVGSLAIGCPDLESLVLEMDEFSDGVYFVSDESMLALLKNCKRLKKKSSSETTQPTFDKCLRNSHRSKTVMLYFVAVRFMIMAHRDSNHFWSASRLCAVVRNTNSS